MTRRSLHILLHWSIVLLLLAMVKGGTAAPWVRWTYSLSIALWIAIAATRGLIGKPGPKLSPSIRAAYPWMHRALYAALGVSAALNIAELTGLITPGPAWISLLVLLGLGSIHGLFHFWRHTALYDNALRLITPRVMHKYL